MTFLENIDKAKLQKILLIAISALILIALALLLVIIIMSIDPSGLESKPNMEFTDLTLSEKDVSAGSLILADAKHPYNVGETNEDWLELYADGCTAYMLSQSDIDPDSKDIVAAKDYGNYHKLNYVPWQNMRLNKTAMAAAHKMLTAAKNEVEQNPITIDAAYDVVKFGSSYEYDTALAILLSDFESTGTDRKALSDEYRTWFGKNAAKYGFIDMGDVEDGYRYVGVAHAKYITEKKTTLADYITYLKENTSNERGLTIVVDGEEYYIYYVSAKAGDSIKIPTDCEGIVSGTNEGGVIVTAKLDK